MNHYNFPTPKQRSNARSSEALLYPYYAGFSEDFVDAILNAQPVPHVVCDPWSGSGTTGRVANRLGLSSVSLDINPVMQVIAKAHALTANEYDELLLIQDHLRASPPSLTLHDADWGDDPLSLWFDAKSVARIRSLELYLYARNHKPRKGLAVNTDTLSALACNVYVALFDVIKSVVKEHFSSSNPTWIKVAKTPSETISLNELSFYRAFDQALTRIMAIHQTSIAKHNVKEASRTDFILADSCALPLEDESVDITITSPPYCTRVDYAVSTRPELAVLGRADAQSFKTLRDSMIGTTTIRKQLLEPNPLWGQSCIGFLQRVQEHFSKASEVYYYKNHLQYFNAMFQSFTELYRVTKKRGELILVIQDSFYKNIHNDVPTFFIEMLESIGFRLNDKQSFNTNSLNNINTRSKTYNQTQTPKEWVLHCSKES